MVDGAGRRVRADAQRNREHILQVAHDAFAESGTMSLNEIAKRAGVGPGTLYRHFPTREALILAVYRRDVQFLLDSVEDLLRTHAPLDAFREWFHTLADYLRVKQGLGEALHSAAAEDAINDSRAPMVTAVAHLIDACAAESSMRSDLHPEDVIQLMSFLWRVTDGPEGKKQARRTMNLAIDGLRPR